MAAPSAPGATPSARVSALTCGRRVKRCSKATVAATGVPSCVAGRNLSARAAATADSSKPKPAERVTLTSPTLPSAPTESSSATVPETPAARACGG